MQSAAGQVDRMVGGDVSREPVRFVFRLCIRGGSLGLAFCATAMGPLPSQAMPASESARRRSMAVVIIWGW